MATTRREQLIRAIRESGLAERDPQIAAILHAAEQGRLSESQCLAYLQLLQPRFALQRDRPNFLPGAPEVGRIYPNGAPDIEIGTAENGVRLGFSLVDRPRHKLLNGTSGSGKTTTIRKIVRTMYEQSKARGQPISFILIDRKASEYADVVDWGDDWVRHVWHAGLRIGLNNPTAIPWRVWVNKICTIFAARASLIASATTLNRLIQWLLPLMNAPGAPIVRWPSFRLLSEVARELPAEDLSYKAEYTQTLLQKLEGVLQATDVFDTFGGLDLERDIIAKGKSVCIDIVSLDPPFLRQFITDLLVAQVLYARTHAGHKVDLTECVFVFDEADADISSESQRWFEEQMSPAVLALKQGRELGIQLIVGVSTLARVSPLAIANIQHHFVFQTTDAEGRDTAAGTLDIHPRAASMLGALKPGECMLRQTDTGYPHALLARIDPVASCRTTNSRVDTHDFIPAVPLTDLQDVQQAIRERKAKFYQQRHKQKREASPTLPDEARKLLEAAVAQPAVPVKELWKSIGVKLSFAKRGTMEDLLRERKLATIPEVRIGSHNYLLIEVSTDGFLLIGKKEVRIPGRGELPHRTYAAWLAMLGHKRGHETRIEFDAPGTSHPIDVAWNELDGGWRAFEIIVDCDTNITSHLHACLLQSTAISRVTIVLPQVSERAKIEKRIAGEATLAGVRDRIDYLNLSSIVNELWL